MLDSLLMVVHAPNLRTRISARIEPYFDEWHVLSNYARAQQWLGANLLGQTPRVVNVEWVVGDDAVAEGLCRQLIEHLTANHLLVIVRDPPLLPSKLTAGCQLRVVSRGRFLDYDLPSWLVARQSPNGG